MMKETKNQKNNQELNILEEFFNDEDLFPFTKIVTYETRGSHIIT